MKKVACLYKRISDGKYTIPIQTKIYDVMNPPPFVCTRSQQHQPDQFLFIRSCNIKVFITGDLVFCACVLGKVNRSSHWCTWCSMASSEWETIDHDKGELWTKEAIDLVEDALLYMIF